MCYLHWGNECEENGARVMKKTQCETGFGANTSTRDTPSHGQVDVDMQGPCRVAGLRINSEIYEEISNRLSDETVSNNWKTLAGCMGYSNDMVKQFTTTAKCYNKHPADVLLDNWSRQSRINDVAKLKEFVRQIERNDIIQLLEHGLSGPCRVAGLRINSEIYEAISNRLSDETVSNNWKVLAGHMGYSNDMVKQFTTTAKCYNKHPADVLLDNWSRQSRINDVAKLKEFAREIERNDIVQLLEHGLSESSNVSNNVIDGGANTSTRDTPSHGQVEVDMQVTHPESMKSGAPLKEELHKIFDFC